MANWRVPKFSLNNCAQSRKKTFMCPKFRTNAVLMYTKCHISTNLSSFLKLCLLYCQKYLLLLQQIADSLKKIGLVGTLLHCGERSCCDHGCRAKVELPSAWKTFHFDH